MSASRSNSLADARTPVAMPMLAEMTKGTWSNPSSVERFPQDRLDPLGHQLRTGRHGHRFGQDDELVTTQAAHGVAGPQHPFEPLRHRLQEPVPGLVAEGVVDVLEVVQVDEQRGHRQVPPPGPGQHLVGPVEDQRAVGEPGEGVVDGGVGQALLGVLPAGDVAQVGHEAVDVGVGRQIGDGRLEPQPVPVGTPQSELLVDDGTGRGPRGGHGGAHRGPVVGVQQGLPMRLWTSALG